MHDPEQLNAVKRQPLDGDDNPAQITAYQAQKCAAILEAYADGQTLYLEHVNTVAQFLKTAGSVVNIQG
jgi:acyl-homoserine lactone acylase PvdQ